MSGTHIMKIHNLIALNDRGKGGCSVEVIIFAGDCSCNILNIFLSTPTRSISQEQRSERNFTYVEYKNANIGVA